MGGREEKRFALERGWIGGREEKRVELVGGKRRLNWWEGREEGCIGEWLNEWEGREEG